METTANGPSETQATAGGASPQPEAAGPAAPAGQPEPAVLLPAAPPAAPAPSPELLALAIEALRVAHPRAVHELISGTTVAELRASLTVAQQAYSRIREQILAEQAQQAVPTGFASHSQAVDLAGLDAGAKIALGLQQRPPG